MRSMTRWLCALGLSAGVGLGLEAEAAPTMTSTAMLRVVSIARDLKDAATATDKRAADDVEIVRELTAPTVQRLERPRWITHRMVPRETLDQLALRYGVEEAWIRRWNELPEEGEVQLKRRAKIKIRTDRIPPPREEIRYTAGPDDTWWRIAVKHGVDSRDLRAYNWNLGKLEPGEELKIWIDPVVYHAIQSHRPNGALDVRPGGVSIGSPNEGRLVNAVQVPQSDLYTLRRPKSAYGTTHAVRELVSAMQRFRGRAGHDHQVNIVAMSRPRGGKLGTHKSHRTGRDVDIRLPLRTTVPRSLYPKPWRVDWLVTWELLRAFAESDEIVYVFLDYKMQRRVYRAAKAAGVDQDELRRVLQYPTGSRSGRGIVRHSPGHTAHFHVRFRCGPVELECVE